EYHGLDLAREGDVIWGRRLRPLRMRHPVRGARGLRGHVAGGTFAPACASAHHTADTLDRELAAAAAVSRIEEVGEREPPAQGGGRREKSLRAIPDAVQCRTAPSRAGEAPDASRNSCRGAGRGQHWRKRIHLGSSPFTFNF